MVPLDVTTSDWCAGLEVFDPVVPASLSSLEVRLSISLEVAARASSYHCLVSLNFF